ncbi:protein FAM13A isoform X6 [Lates calcarifer]|uniref:Protein FAM13A isoform X6 n=1 Tax=Lates calcarifer TaxID=8187 RepID=A0AAJ8B5W4_LATCA|nr:protein FAM13A isoform X6 [Lates calcarifer]
MGAGALTICHNKTAVQVKEDMKKMVQIPILRPRTVAAKHTKLFGASLFELREKGMVEDGVPLVVRRMVEHLRKHECGDDGSWSDMRDLIQQLPDVHHSLLRYLCHFLTLVECNHKDNRMTALNLATVFGPSVFHVAPGFEALKEQNICNKIMVKLIQNYNSIFETNREKEGCTDELSTLIIVKSQEAHVMDADTKKSPSHLNAKTPTPAPGTKVGQKNTPENTEQNKSCTNTPKERPRKKKVRKGKSDGMPGLIPQLSHSARLPHARPLSIVLPLTSELRSPSPEAMETTPTPLAHQDTPDVSSPLGQLDVSPSGSVEALSSSQEEERPISPFYMSNHLSPVHCRPDVVNFLDRTIRSAVEQHLFDINPSGDQSSEDSESTPRPPSPKVTATARQRRRQQREQHDDSLRHRDRNSRAPSVSSDTNKENIPSSGGSSSGSVGDDTGSSSLDSQGGHAEQTSKPRKSKYKPTLVQLSDNQDTYTVKECVGEKPGPNLMDTAQKGNDISRKDGHPSPSQTLRMKIQESPVTCDTGRVSSGEVRGSDPDCEKTSCEDVPRLDLTALTEDNNWGDSPFFNTPFLDFKTIFHLSCDEPVPAYSSLQRESMDREEARLSPHAGGGRLIRQLLEEDSDPMLSPRFYAYGQCQQYLDDTEVPPSPPNAHSFVSRRRSSSLGSCDDEKEELTSAQLTKRIHVLKKKIHRFEEKFEEERKYRPSHSDKAANPEVLRWMTELAKLRKELKEHKLMKSEEDLPPLTRQRSNTLPKSFGSQLEKKPQQEKVPKPPVESTLETILKKLQEKREEVNRPEDIKDMTREQIGAEKVALQKALLYYESIHGRPVTKSERQIMKPLYDRYRLVKQILCRASTIPVIGSPSSKRRGPLLQPIIEGETALFFDDIKEEEDGSEDDGDSKTQFTVTVRPDLSVLGFLDHMDEEVDGFISPVDELSPSKNMTDMRLSNLHSATMQELVEQLQETREEKKRIRKNLKEFEDQFFRQNGRNVQKEDRSPLAVEYSEYKHIKAKLRLLEVLISKRDSAKLI